MKKKKHLPVSILILFFLASGMSCFSWSGRNLDEDLHHFEDQLRHEPDNPDTNYNIAQVYFLMNKIDLALKFYERAAFLAPDDVEILNRLAEIYWKIGRTGNARDRLKHLLRLTPQDSEAWYGLGMVCADLAENSAALEAFANAVKYGNDAERKKIAIYYMGLINLSSRDYVAFSGCLEQLPQESAHYRNLRDLGRLWQPEKSDRKP